MPKAIPPSPSHLEKFINVLLAFDAYAHSFDALEEFLDALTPHAAELDSDERIMEKVFSHLASLPEELLSAVKDQISKALPPEPEITPVRAVLGLLEAYPGQQWAVDFVQEFITLASRESRLTLLRRGVLITAVGAFETLLADIWSFVYHAKPQLYGKGFAEKVFSLEDLAAFEGVDSARDYLIEGAINSHLRSTSFEEWSKWWKDNLGFGFDEVCATWDSLREIIQRRHVLVHNLGRVSKEYRRRLGIQQEDPPIGSKLTLNPDYMREALTQLSLLGSLLAAVTIIDLQSGFASEMIKTLESYERNRLFRGRWQTALVIAEAAPRLRLTTEMQVIFTIDRWLCQKRLGTLVMSEVAAYDASALQTKYRLFLAALQERIDDAFELFIHAYEADELDLSVIYSYPILDPLRADKRFRQFLITRQAELQARYSHKDWKELDVVISADGNRFHAPSSTHVKTAAVPIPKHTAVAMGLRPCHRCFRAVGNSD